MKIRSSKFDNNSAIPIEYTCDGRDINPPLDFSEIPKGTKSLTLIVDDPDAPGGTWVHWLVWNINPNESEIKENSVPTNSVQGTTSSGDIGYGGPCPPNGLHHYFFKLYALDIMIDLKIGANKDRLEQAMQGHILDKGELLGLYSRK